MSSPKSGWREYDLGIKIVETKLADTDVVRVCVPVGKAGLVKEVWVGLTVIPTTGNVAIAKSAATNVNLLTATNVDMASATTTLVAFTAANQTLAAGVADLRVAAGDMLTAVWTLTNITTGGGVPNVFACTICIEHDEW
jgi:hypothetical protein